MTNDDFYQWLDECPVQWFQFHEDGDYVNINFILSDTDMEDD